MTSPSPSPWRIWRAMSMTLKIAILFALISYAGVIGVSMSLYDAMRDSLETRADYQLIARVEHLRTLLHDLYTVQELEARPALFETMLGNEQDVILFRRASPGRSDTDLSTTAKPFIDVNPRHTPIPDLAPVPSNRAIMASDLLKSATADDLPVRWISARATIGNQGNQGNASNPSSTANPGEQVDIVASHVMTLEEQVLRHYRMRVIWTMMAAVFVTTLLGAYALRRGLAPLRDMAQRVTQIGPERMTPRLDEASAPRELQQFARSFNDMLERLANGYHRLVQFSADLAHEVRTPIGALIGQTQVALGRPREPEEYRLLLESNLEELERLARISQNILFLAQADHETTAIDRTTQPILPIIEQVQSYFEGLAEERGLRFDVSASGQVDAHPDMLRRAISNVIVNAVRYARTDSAIVIRAHTRAQTLTQGELQQTVFTVGNQSEGDGLSETACERLFDRFYRGDASRSEWTESSGLGLPIVRAIMTLHGGTAQIHCSASGWIDVILTFPQKTL